MAARKPNRKSWYTGTVDVSTFVRERENTPYSNTRGTSAKEAVQCALCRHCFCPFSTLAA